MNDQIPQRVLDILEWNVIEQELVRRCKTPLAEKIIGGLSPLDREQAGNRMRKISNLKDIFREKEVPDFSGITDIGPQVELAAREGTLRIEDLAEIKNFIRGSDTIARFLKSHRDRHESLDEEYKKFQSLADLRDILTRSITENNEINDNSYPELKRIKDELHASRQEIEARIQKLIHSSAMDHLLQEKIFTTRNDRYVILVKSGMKDRVRGTVLDVSSSGATCFIEPSEITPLNNRAILLEKELQNEIRRILRALSRNVAENAAPLMNNLQAVSFIDFLSAAALFSIDIRGAEPEISPRNELVLYGARHPMLHLMSPGTVVPNDIRLGDRHNCLVISGANTGGKTVLLKTIGLCALFAMVGLHLPAGPDSRIGVFSRIFADIGDDQNLSRSLSTFSGQIMIINEMVEKADESTLVIIDEIIVGTNPRQGAALAQAILESLIETGSKILVTTHYPDLKQLPSLDERFQNASVSFDMQTLRPTYRLITGLPGVSYAVEIARNCGLPEKVLSRSRELLDSGELSAEALIEKVQQFEREMAEEKERLALLSRELAAEKTRCEERESDLNRRAGQIKKSEGIDFLHELGEHRRRVSARISALQGMNIQEAGAAQKELRDIEERVRAGLEHDRNALVSSKYLPFDPASAGNGDIVYVVPLETEGIVENIDLMKNSAQVILGNAIKSTFDFTDLYRRASAPPARQNREKKKAPRGDAAEKDDSAIPAVIQTRYNTVDLRGKRVEEGLRVMERDFDRMIRSNIDTAVVIHGHGTGAMKEAVREYLRSSLYVSGSRPGELGEGGDGVTIVRLRA